MSELGKELAKLLRLSAEQALGDEIERTIHSQTGPSAKAPGSPTEWRIENTVASASTVSTPMMSTPWKSASSDTSSTTAAVVNAVLDGMGLSPILRGLLSLFGGGNDEPAPPLPRYSAPASVRVNAGIRANSAAAMAIDYGEGGEAREIASQSPSVIVNVSAMDTQSFLDRSDDIALAVKRALLESHSLNDVIAEL